ncbi:MAG: sigma-54 dependent transcriptional regulator, acetoin dehydrogenase operon transcriptional [Pseudonocardiales bacterium]|jgi:transcriptional regulator of acetoin/glycerol metabolism|nr:sigma-54 dependent transcriptional regulator, acetoin dehydrogenase operon transcriptional [Pseudonocardiales bacterium]
MLRVAAARAGFLSTGVAETENVPDLIAASWRRSSNAGVDAVNSDVPYHQDLDMSSRLVRCSQPIIERLSEETADIPLSIALTDGTARVLSRVDTSSTIGILLDNVSFAPGFDYAEGQVGTNGVGTVFESGQPIHIVGPEHFHEHLQPFACAGAPIRDPLSGRVEGVLDISCLTEHSSPLMHSLVRSAAQNIERNLLLDRSHRQQALFESFIRLDSRSKAAVIAMDGSVVMNNALAQALFDAAEQRTIQEHARYLMVRSNRAVDQIELPSGKVVRLRAMRIAPRTDAAGIVVEVALHEGAPTTAPVEDFALAVQHPVSTNGDRLTLPKNLLDVRTLSSSGQSPAWTRACGDIATALSEHQPLLVVGETGTGKFSLIAELYHRVHNGGRSMLIDAADISPDSYGDAEQALDYTATPTLYIYRNIDALSTDGAERLSEFLLALADTDRPAYVAATLSDANIDSDLPFREVLVHFQRAVTVPPLRHRTEDLATLVPRVLAKLAPGRDRQLTPAAMRVVVRYSWPRNIGQLEDALRAALSKRPVGDVQPDDLPGYCHNTSRRQLSGLESIERDAIVKALHDARGNRVHAAQALGIARSSLYRKLRSYGIETI